MKTKGLLFIIVFFTLSNLECFAQELKMDSIDVMGTVLLFENYQETGKHCTNRNGTPKHCNKEERILDNNIEYLLQEQINTLSYLDIRFEIIDKEKLQKDIYNDSAIFRYYIESTPAVSQEGNSCFSNPGALIFKYSLFDRFNNTRHAISLEYAFFMCDLQLLVNDINKSIKKSTEN